MLRQHDRARPGAAALLACALCLCVGAAGAAGERPNLALGGVKTRTLEDVPLVRGKTPNGLDRIVFRGATYLPIELIRVGDTPGKADYKPKQDVVLQHQFVSWRPAGREPKAGATYYVTLKHILTESSHNTTGWGVYATDGNRRSAWRAISPAWIYVDLGKPATIGEVHLYQLPEKYLAKTLRLQWAPDGLSDRQLRADKVWKDVVPAGDWKNPLTGDAVKERMRLLIRPVEMRYFRVVAPHGARKFRAVRIREIELYAPE